MGMKEVREVAKERMKGFCRVCAVCDGKVCAGETPGMGGAGTGSSFHNNMSALKDVRLNMRLVHEAKNPLTSCNILGLELSMPILAAPIGGVSFNMGGAITEVQYINAIIEGCRSVGIIGCTGDGVPPFIYESGFDAIKNAGGWGIPFIKPWDSQELDEKLEKAAATGCQVMGVDIDAAGLITLAQMGRPVSPKNMKELRTMVEKVHGFGAKFILKGIMTVEDAVAAVETGCDGIVVSNHGGRVLDHCPGSAEILPMIANKIKNKLCIIADGGIRDGVDVLKMLALGADAVMIGRPYSIAALGGEGDAVRGYSEVLRGQLVQAMVLTGCASIKEAGMHLVNLKK